MNQNIAKHQNPNIDILRAIAVLSVVAHHIFAFTGFRIYYFSDVGVLIGVQLFFIISGYLISESASKHSLRAYALHRFLRIFPAYWVAFIAIGVLSGVLSAGNIMQRPGSFLLSLANLQQLYPVALLELDVLHVSWTLTVELLWYLLAPLLLVTYRRWAWVSFCVLVVVSTLWSMAASRHYLDGMYAGGFAAMTQPVYPGQADILIKFAFPVQLMFFGVGALIFRYKEQAVRIPTSWLLLAIFVSSIMFDHYSSYVPLYSVLPGLGPTAFFILMLSSSPVKVPFLAYLGKISYSIYLLHFPIIIWCAKKFGSLGNFHLLITITCIVGLSHLMYRAIEEPCMRYARRFRPPHITGEWQRYVRSTLALGSLALLGLIWPLVNTAAFTVNTTTAPMTGLWWNPDEPGWGMIVEQQGPIMFVGWYTYDLSGASTRYFISNCAVSGNGCSGNIYRISGGATLTAEWKGHGPVTTVGAGTLTFSSNNSGVFNFVLNGVPGFKKVVRNEFGTKVVPPSVDYTALWWNPEEPGWGMFVSHQSKNIFAALFTYDASGNPIRYLVSNCPVSGSSCTGTLYKTSGGSAPTVPWGGPVTLTPVGAINLVFSDASHGTMSFTIDGQSGSKRVSKMIFYAAPN